MGSRSTRQEMGTVSRRLIDPPDRDPEDLEQLVEAVQGILQAPEQAQVILGRYHRIGPLGSGSFGSVDLAYDPTLQREVAIKSIRRQSARLDPDAARRLVREARTLAKLSHPNIVRVYDVSIADRPESPQARAPVQSWADETARVVMEYVEGPTLRTWMRAPSLSVREILRVFADAGRGIAAAHGVGVIHRDFKPANVIVGADGRTRVLDFGLARSGGTAADSVCSATSRDPRDRGIGAIGTATGALIGTPAYMAPEQRRGLADERSDQYSFCVSIAEALYAATGSMSRDQVLEQIETGAPMSCPRGKVPHRVELALRQGLRADRRQRFATMSELVGVLHSATIAPTRRGRWVGVSAVAAVVMAGAAAASETVANDRRCTGAELELAAVWDDARRAQVSAAVLAVERKFARQVWGHISRELDEFAADWAAQHQEVCTATSIRREQSAVVMELRMSCLRRAKAQLEAVVDVLVDADADTVIRAHELTGELPALSRCADVAALQRGVELPAPNEQEVVREIQARVARADAARRVGRYPLAEQHANAATELAGTVTYGPVQTEVSRVRGEILDELGQYDAAEAALREAMAHAARWRQPAELAGSATSLMSVLGNRQQRPAEALHLWPLVHGLVSGEPLHEARARTALATILRARGEYDKAMDEHRDAIELFRSVLHDDHALVASSRLGLAVALEELGRFPEAEAEYRSVVRIRKRTLGAAHPDVARSRAGLAALFAASGRYEEAEAEGRRALELLIAGLGPTHPQVAGVRNNLGAALFQQGKHGEAEAQFRDALAIYVESHGDTHPQTLMTRSNLAGGLLHAGKHEAAALEMRRLIALQEVALGPQHRDTGASHHNLAMCLRAQGELAEAEIEFRRGEAISRAALGENHAALAVPAMQLGALLRQRGDLDGAEAKYRTALALREQAFGPEHPLVIEARDALGVVLLDIERNESEAHDLAPGEVDVDEAPASRRRIDHEPE